MAWGRAALGLVLAVALAAGLVSGGSREDSVRLRYLPDSNELRTVVEYGRARVVDVRSLGAPLAIGADPHWLARARPLDPGAPGWARRMYRRSLLVLGAVTDPRSGAVVAGLRDGWEYVWPRDAGAVAIALASAGYRSEARRIARFLLSLDLEAAARFHRDGSPVPGRAAQGDAAGWIAATARAAGLHAEVPQQPWRGRADYQEGEPGDYLGNAIASTAGEPKGTTAGDLSVRRPAEREIREEFGTRRLLVREAGDPESGMDSTAAWAVRPFPHPALPPGPPHAVADRGEQRPLRDRPVRGLGRRHRPVDGANGVDRLEPRRAGRAPGRTPSHDRAASH